LYSDPAPSAPARTRLSREYIPPNNAGVRRTLQVMRELADEADPVTSWWAGRLLRRAGGNPDLFPLELRSWLEGVWTFEEDPDDVETVRSPGFQLRQGSFTGDCDDVATLAAGLARAVGLSGRFRVLAFDPGRNYSHVLAEVLAPGPPGVWYDMDETRPPGMVPQPTSEMVVYFP